MYLERYPSYPVVVEQNQQFERMSEATSHLRELSVLSEEEAFRYRTAFDRFDRAGIGSIPGGELAALLRVLGVRTTDVRCGLSPPS